MTDRPIIFSAPMVRALLEGRKAQTRRTLSIRGHKRFTDFGKSDTTGFDWHFRRFDMCWCDFTNEEILKRLPYKVGDRLYVREAFAYVGSVDPGWLLHRATYKESCDGHGFDKPYPPEGDVNWKPSIHMPRSASRITLNVNDVRIERLQDISDSDAEAEGVGRDTLGWFDYLMPSTQACMSARGSFATLWDSINGKRQGSSWADNPWVVAVSFNVVKRNIDQ